MRTVPRLIMARDLKCGDVVRIGTEAHRLTLVYRANAGLIECLTDDGLTRKFPIYHVLNLVPEKALDQREVAPALSNYAIEFDATLVEELNAVGQMLKPDFDATQSYPRLTWLTIAYTALGKAEELEKGRFDMGDDDDARTPEWTAQLRQSAEIILDEFKPGDGKL